MPGESKNTDQDLIELLKNGNDTAIDAIFRSYYKLVCNSIYRIIPNPVLVEDLSQDVFYELWKKRKDLKITSLKAYLNRAGRNKALNYLRDQKIQTEDFETANLTLKENYSVIHQLERDEMQKIINQAIETLPERCRAVFVLSRFEEMSYQEIADHLNISIKTVENQISKALKHLRNVLYPHLTKFPMLLILVNFEKFWF